MSASGNFECVLSRQSGYSGLVQWPSAIHYKTDVDSGENHADWFPIKTVCVEPKSRQEIGNRIFRCIILCEQLFRAVVTARAGKWSWVRSYPRSSAWNFTGAYHIHAGLTGLRSHGGRFRPAWRCLPADRSHHRESLPQRGSDDQTHGRHRLQHRPGQHERISQVHMYGGNLQYPEKRRIRHLSQEMYAA